MFTGLVEHTGTLVSLDRASGGAFLRVASEPWDEPLALGESVAVQGACLTVRAAGEGEFTCDVLDETLSRTTLADQGTGTRLNLERALKLGQRLGGHIVSGHVDGIGEVQEVRPAGRDWVLAISCDAELLEGIVTKGSICCDGVSLTVSALASDAFEVSIIPFTWQQTSLSALQPGSAVNLEIDMLGKYVKRYVEALAGRSELSVEDLRRAGWAV